MNPNWTDAQNLLDLVDHVWIGIVVITAAAIPSWFSYRNHRGISEVRQQVLNAHKTNLRDDLDRAIAAVEALSHDVRGLRVDLASEEDRRRKQIDEIRIDLDGLKRR